jgi:Fe-S cluster assembly protein SufD
MSAALSSLDARREKALENFLVHGMPHRRIEDWKYSNLRVLLDAGQVAQAGTAQWRIEELPDGVELFDLAALGNAAPGWVTRNLGSLGDGSTM